MTTDQSRPNRPDAERPPLYLTENGAAVEDRAAPDGRIRDPRRQVDLRRHIVEMQRAMQAGADVRGYFVWSLLDNFEWIDSYERRFGIVPVDCPTQERRIKESGLDIATSSSQIPSRAPGVRPEAASLSHGGAGSGKGRAAAARSELGSRIQRATPG